jgi:hypothetical protein
VDDRSGRVKLKNFARAPLQFARIKEIHIGKSADFNEDQLAGLKLKPWRQVR